MRFMKKLPLAIKTQREQMRFSAFALSGGNEHALRAWESKNCDCTDNVLRAGYGMETVYCPTVDIAKTSVGLPERCQFFAMPGVNALDEPTENIGALGEDGTLYTYQYLNGKWLPLYTFGSKMRAVRAVLEDGAVQTVFIGEAGLYLFTYGKPMITSDVEDCGAKAHLACMAQGRLFFVSGAHTIRYSRAYDPLNFVESVQDGGSVQLPSAYGEVIDLVAFGNRVGVVYEHGFSYVEIAGDASAFTVQTIEHPGGSIFTGSVGVLGSGTKTLFFLSEQGVYKWSGNGVERVCKNLSIFPKRTGQVCEHGFFEGKYILTYYEQGNVRKCVVVDAETGEGYFATAPFGLSEYKGGTLCYYGSFVRKLHRQGALPSGETRSFSVFGLQWGRRGKKRLETIEVEGRGALQVVVTAGGKSKRFAVSCTNGKGVISVQMRAERFDIRLELLDNTQVDALTVQSVQCRGLQ